MIELGLALDIYPLAVASLRRGFIDRVYASDASLAYFGVICAVLSPRYHQNLIKISRALRVSKVFRSRGVDITDLHVICIQRYAESEFDIARPPRTLSRTMERTDQLFVEIQSPWKSFGNINVLEIESNLLSIRNMDISSVTVGKKVPIFVDSIVELGELDKGCSS